MAIIELLKLQNYDGEWDDNHDKKNAYICNLHRIFTYICAIYLVWVGAWTTLPWELTFMIFPYWICIYST